MGGRWGRGGVGWVSVLQDGKSSGAGLHNTMNILNTTELYT